MMLWGGIWKEGKTPIVVMERDLSARRHGYTSWSYIQALEEGLIPVYNGSRQFMQDNAAIHTSQASKRWLLEHTIQWIGWPPYSPDLNPIEHVWKLLKDKIRALFPHVRDLKDNEADKAEFKRCVKLAWEAIETPVIQRLVSSLPRRLAAVIRARGWYTRY